MNNRNIDGTSGHERSERKSLKEIRGIHVASEEQIKQLINEAYDFAANADDVSYGRGRGAERLLTPGRDYAELPGFMARSPRDIIESLPSMSRILDVGCGYGRLGAEILGTTALADPSGNSEDADIFSFREDNMPAINPNAEVYGYDAQAQRGQHRLTGVAIGNIDHLSPSTFSECPDGFDLIISSSVLYHLPDYWGGILRMTRVENLKV